MQVQGLLDTAARRVREASTEVQLLLLSLVLPSNTVAKLRREVIARSSQDEPAALGEMQALISKKLCFVFSESPQLDMWNPMVPFRQRLEDI